MSSSPAARPQPATEDRSRAAAAAAELLSCPRPARRRPLYGRGRVARSEGERWTAHGPLCVRPSCTTRGAHTCLNREGPAELPDTWDVRLLGGTPDEVFDDPGLWALFAPTVRAGLRLVARIAWERRACAIGRAHDSAGGRGGSERVCGGRAP